MLLWSSLKQYKNISISVHSRSLTCYSQNVYAYILYTGFPGGSDSKESAGNAGDLGSIPGLGRSPGGRHSNPLQYSLLKNPHGQRSLEGCSPWGHRVRHDWATKHSSTTKSGICPFVYYCMISTKMYAWLFVVCNHWMNEWMVAINLIC